MKILNLGRRNGKTAMIIHSAAVTDTPIITRNVGMKQNIISTAEKMGFRNIEVYTADEWLKHGICHRHSRAFIDEAETLLEAALNNYFNTNVTAITFSIPMIEINKEDKNDE